ncbi:hypothetical protein [Parasitella parasitica]|uniref:Uncharacterized protein n=1 Tax=Parasitella parasitica TaxID=35722 RepID=A0A0B7NDW8_9FUNG|nr:hypothetical protein [Parasitella parasitica]
MGKRRRFSSNCSDNALYEPPTVKGSSASCSSSSRPTKFKPSKEAFTTLLNDAFKSRLSRTIHANAKKASKEDNESIKATQLNRRKVPPGTFEELDAQYGGYWPANTFKRLEMNALSLYKDFVETNFDELLNSIRENKEIVPVEDFSCAFSFLVEMCMIGFATLNNNTFGLKSIIPKEFQPSFENMSLPAAPVVPPSSVNTYNDYVSLFSLSHLQIISTLNFGIAGVQAKTNDSHPLWIELDQKTSPTSQTNNSGNQTDSRLQEVSNMARTMNTTIKNMAVSQLSYNIKNIYADEKMFKKTLDRLLLSQQSAEKSQKPEKTKKDVAEEEDNIVNISLKRLRRIKGSLKWKPPIQNEETVISKETMVIDDITDEELGLC